MKENKIVDKEGRDESFKQAFGCADGDLLRSALPAVHARVVGYESHHQMGIKRFNW